MLDEQNAPVNLEAQPGASQSPFYIASSGAPSRPRCIMKQNDCFAILDTYGDIGCSSDSASGLFSNDTRHLSRLALKINGMEPLLLGSTLRDDNLNLRADLTNPDIYSQAGIEVLKDTVHIDRTIYLHEGCLSERSALTNHSMEPVSLDLTIEFDSDFADLFEVRGMRRAARGKLRREVTGPNGVLFSYEGLDGKERRTKLEFDPAPEQVTDRFVRYRLTLAPLQCWRQYTSVSCDGQNQPPAASFLRGLIQARRELISSTAPAAAIQLSNTVYNEIVCGALADLRMLMTATPDGRYPYAGIPWYSTTFGRDGIITAMQLLWYDPSIAKGVLKRLARFQSTGTNPASDAEPGKILHEMRSGEMAALGEVPFGLYYGSVDSTPLFVLLAGLYVQRTGDEEFLKEIWPHVERALDWMDGPGDPDGDGFLEYSRATGQGLQNQGWKDSYDSIFHQDGGLAEGAVALVEVQGYAYAARIAAADCARRLRHRAQAEALLKQAERLRLKFEEAFWCEDLQTYALALDGKKRPCRVRTSNAAHALFTGIMSPERARLVADGILRPSFNSGWGVRTVASGEVRYNPMSYHNGSIWPHDNAMIASGLARYGFTKGLQPIFTGLMQAAAYMEGRRLPELFCGFPRRRSRGPTLYPVACAPQAWASGAVFQLLQAILGLEYDLPANAITLRNPSVPVAVGEITIRNLTLGGSSISFAVRPHADGTVSLRVLGSSGNIKISAVFDAPAA
jgi:glycogen debranching enzyme